MFELESQSAVIQSKIEEPEYLNRSYRESIGKKTKRVCCAFLMSLKSITIWYFNTNQCHKKTKAQ
ncbi:MAG: hypothetical protein ACTHKJ_00020, partial [Candidatus Nitrosocosmicus sp.]